MLLTSGEITSLELSTDMNPSSRIRGREISRIQKFGGGCSFREEFPAQQRNRERNSNTPGNIVRISSSFIKTFNTVEQCRTLVLSSTGKLG